MWALADITRAIPERFTVEMSHRIKRYTNLRILYYSPVIVHSITGHDRCCPGLAQIAAGEAQATANGTESLQPPLKVGCVVQR